MKRILMWLIVVFMAIAGAVVARAEGVPEVPPSEDKPIAAVAAVVPVVPVPPRSKVLEVRTFVPMVT